MNLPTDFWSNPWNITILGGVAVVFISFLAKRLLGGSSSTKTPSNENHQNTVVTTNVYPTPPESNASRIVPSADVAAEIPAFKSNARILFIEDGTFKQITNLKNAGWHVTQIKDVVDLHASEIQDANIVFVDFKDVGKKLSDEEGLGVVRALKDRYGKSKWIVLYSAHPMLLSVFKKGADSYLAKNSSLLEIEHEVIQGARAVCV